MAKHMYHFNLSTEVEDNPASVNFHMELEINDLQTNQERYALGEHLANKLGITFVSEEKLYHLNHDF